MLSKPSSASETSATCGAFERLLAGVIPLMHLQRIFALQFLAAVLATELGCLVEGLVLSGLAWRSKSLVAVLTLVSCICGMSYEDMVVPVVHCCKCHWTKFARVLNVIVYRFYVKFEIGFGSKSFATLFTVVKQIRILGTFFLLTQVHF